MTDTEADTIRDAIALVRSVLESEDRTLWSFGDSRILDATAKLVKENLGSKDYAVFLKSLKQEVLDFVPESDAQSNLKALHVSVAACKLCSDVEPNPTFPLWNLEDPDVLIVTTRPLRQGEAGADLLIEAMKEAGLSSRIVAATSVARCPSSKKKHSDETLSECATRYLFKEMLYLRPSVIVALGSAPVSMLLAETGPVKDAVGSWRHLGPWAIMPSYDPSYAANSDSHTREFKQHIHAVSKVVLP